MPYNLWLLTNSSDEALKELVLPEVLTKVYGEGEPKGSRSQHYVSSTETTRGPKRASWPVTKDLVRV